MKQVSVAVIKKDGFVLSISRKDNHYDLGLVGGKVEEGETPEQAVIREVMEEVGLKGINPKLIDTRVYDGNENFCFVFEDVEGWEELTLGVTNEGFVSFRTEEELCENMHSYSDYNSEIFKLLK
jgi:mutator protein MutT